ncbi:hypothetical protein [Xanthomonas phage JGB6]|nr:hypothetical protein [Xanthomonas phage JGB6]
MPTVTLAEYLASRGLPPINHAEYEMHSIAVIGDLSVEASEHAVNVKCDDEIIMTIMRQDGGLRELAEALLGLAK